MNIPGRGVAAALAMTMLTLPGGQLAAQEPLARARALYAAAAYEDALSELAKVEPAAGDRGEVEQYRAFCLIALGRTGDAERAIEIVVLADPLLVPRPADVPPRILAMFTDVRRRILPGIARRAYLDGRSAFQAKDFATATRQFDLSMRLIAQAGSERVPEMDDLQLLVSGFFDLARAATERPSREASDRDPAAPLAAPHIQAPRSEETSTAPVTIRQELPPWKPPTVATGERAYVGAVKILIGPDGRVQHASMVKPVHPMYDPLVLEAARQWMYRPATRLGEPTAAVKVIEIRLAPR